MRAQRRHLTSTYEAARTLQSKAPQRQRACPGAGNSMRIGASSVLLDMVPLSFAWRIVRWHVSQLVMLYISPVMPQIRRIAAVKKLEVVVWLVFAEIQVAVQGKD